MKNIMYRQGDVLVRKVPSIPAGAKPTTIKERLVLAYGEVTGHAHAIHEIDRVALFEIDGRRFLKINGEPVELRHEEHSAHAIPAGTYEITIQREYSPEAIRNVAD